MSAARNFYETLGVPQKATKQEIRVAYYKLAPQYHPDKKPGDATAEEMFKKVTAAYATLSDEEARAAYNKRLADGLDEEPAGTTQQQPLDPLLAIFANVYAPDGVAWRKQGKLVFFRGKEINSFSVKTFTGVVAPCLTAVIEYEKQKLQREQARAARAARGIFTFGPTYQELQQDTQIAQAKTNLRMIGINVEGLSIAQLEALLEKKTQEFEAHLQASQQFDRYLQNFGSDWLTIATSFLGIPNRQLDKKQGQSWLNILKNFIGWDDQVSLGQKVVNGLLAPFVITLHLIAIPFMLALNIVKLVTEFLPLFLSSKMLPDSLAILAQIQRKENIPGSRIAYFLFLTVAILLNFIVGLFLRALTSPVKTIQEQLRNVSESASIPGTIFQAVLLVLMAAYIITMYSVLLPLAWQFIAAYVLPFIATTFPSLLSNAAVVTASQFLAPALQALSQTVVPVLTAMGQGIIPVVNVLFKIITFGAVEAATFLQTMPAVVALATAIITIAVTAGPKLTELLDEFREWWHKEAKAPAYTSVPMSDPVSPASSQAPAPSSPGASSDAKVTDSLPKLQKSTASTPAPGSPSPAAKELSSPAAKELSSRVAKELSSPAAKELSSRGLTAGPSVSLPPAPENPLTATNHGGGATVFAAPPPATPPAPSTAPAPSTPPTITQSGHGDPD